MEHAPKFDIATLWETKRQNDLFWRSVLAYDNYEDKIALAIADSLSKSEQEQISSLLGHIESVIPQNYLYDSARQERYPFYELSYREIDRQSYNSILIHYPGTNIDDPEYIVVATDLKQVKIPFLENIVQYYVPQAGTLIRSMTLSQERTKLWPMNLMNVVGMAQPLRCIMAMSAKRPFYRNWIAHYPEQLTITYIKGWQVLEHCHRMISLSIIMICR